MVATCSPGPDVVDQVCRKRSMPSGLDAFSLRCDSKRVGLDSRLYSAVALARVPEQLGNCSVPWLDVKAPTREETRELPSLKYGQVSQLVFSLALGARAYTSSSRVMPPNHQWLGDAAARDEVHQGGRDHPEVLVGHEVLRQHLQIVAANCVCVGCLLSQTRPEG